MKKPKPKSALDRLAKLTENVSVTLMYSPRFKPRPWMIMNRPIYGHVIGTGRTPEEAAANALRQIEGNG